MEVKTLWMLMDYSEKPVAVFKTFEAAALRLIEDTKEQYPGEWDACLADYECEDDMEQDILQGLDVINPDFFYIESIDFYDC